jgi:hypothetical protein
MDQGHSLRENIDDWKLNLDDWSWERLTSRNWQLFAIRRKDKKPIYLWDIRHALWNLEMNMEDSYKTDMERVESWLGFRPDVKLIRNLYDFDIEHDDLHIAEDTYNLFWIYIDDVRVRFKEEMHSLQVVVEGGLAPHKVRLIKEQLIARLSTLEDSPFEVEE